MNTNSQQIRADVDSVLADLPALDVHTGVEGVAETTDIEAIDAVGRRLEQAHQILVDALESVEKG